MPVLDIGAIVGAVLTLFILSYLIADNWLYRFAVHVLVGVGAAYITFTVLVDILWLRIVKPFVDLQTTPLPTGQMLLDAVVAAVGLLLGALLLFKALPRWAWIGNIPVGYLVGVGAAVALGGALFGTIGAQVAATASPLGGYFAGTTGDRYLNFWLNVLIVFVTSTTLLSFGFYRVARRGVLSSIHSIGRFFLAIALGATFALVYVASVTLLIDRVQALTNVAGFFIPK
jgi:hypothetical protein